MPDQLISMAPLVIALGLTYVLYRRSQTTSPVPVAESAAVSDGSIDAVEYYWRPG